MSNEQLIFRLVEALRQWLCPACGGKKTYTQRGWEKHVFVNREVPCTKCNGTGLHPIAQEAIDRVEGKKP
jgi:DnaJ-class molecular chaperone